MEVNNSILDYVKIIAYKYCSDFDLSGDDGKEVNELDRVDLLGAIIEDGFSNYYESLYNEHKDGHDIYINNVSIQDTIRKMGLDSDKLWCAVLFVDCFVDGCYCMVTRSKAPTTREKAARLLKKLDRYSTIIVKDKDGKECKVNDIFLNLAFKKLLEGICTSSDGEYDARFVPLVNDEDFSTAKLAYFTEILQYLLNKLYTPKNPSKLTFIAQLAMVLKMFNPKKVGELDSDKKVVLGVDIDGYVYKEVVTKQEETLAKLLGSNTIDGKKCYKDSIDLGKLLSDKIKKNRTEPEPSGSNLYYSSIVNSYI